MTRSRPYGLHSRSGRGAAALGLTLALASLLAVAAPPGDQATLRGAVIQPLRDLNIMRTTVAEPLQAARAAPCDVADLKECQAIRAQIAELDAALGPDVDEDQVQPGMVRTLAASAVRSAVKLPFSGVVRQLSGANAHERVRQQSVQAGMARRAFLKGVALTRCNPGGDMPYLQVAAAAPVPAVELHPAIEAEPARVQVAHAQGLRAEPVRQVPHEPVYVWVASDPRGLDAPGGR